MKKFPLEKYKYYFAGNKIIACSTYAGRIVRGVAICHPDDKFDVERGKYIAAMRCNEKVAIKRYARALNKYTEACEARDKAIAYVDEMKAYLNDSYIAMNEASQQVDTLKMVDKSN